MPAARRSNRRPHPQHLAKLAEIAECDRRGLERIGVLSDEAFLAAGAALYAGEGAKTRGKVTFANTDPAMVAFFCAWLRRFFAIDESRLRVRVYLHEGLDLDAAETFWSEVTGVPRAQFEPSVPGRRPTRRSGGTSTNTAASTSATACSRTHREIMGLVRALLTSGAIPG